jgi:hypothetical protein
MPESQDVTIINLNILDDEENKIGHVQLDLEFLMKQFDAYYARKRERKIEETAGVELPAHLDAERWPRAHWEWVPLPDDLLPRNYLLLRNKDHPHIQRIIVVDPSTRKDDDE